MATQFPILIEYTNGDPMDINSIDLLFTPEDIPRGKVFKVLATRVGFNTIRDAIWRRAYAVALDSFPKAESNPEPPPPFAPQVTTPPWFRYWTSDDYIVSVPFEGRGESKWIYGVKIHGTNEIILVQNQWYGCYYLFTWDKKSDAGPWVQFASSEYFIDIKGIFNALVKLRYGIDLIRDNILPEKVSIV
jgi:hypothetical protein